MLEVETNARPVYNDEMKMELARRIGEQVFEWCGGETPLEDCIASTEHILECYCIGDNGYELARRFEDEGYCPDLELVEILDNAGAWRSAILRDATRKWVTENKIEPKFQIGDAVTVKCVNEVLVGEIAGFRKDTAEYLVYIPPKGWTKESRTKAVVKYEDAELLNRTDREA